MRKFIETAFLILCFSFGASSVAYKQGNADAMREYTTELVKVRDDFAKLRDRYDELLTKYIRLCIDFIKTKNKGESK